jgi:hypothetical protein
VWGCFRSQGKLVERNMPESRSILVVGGPAPGEPLPIDLATFAQELGRHVIAKGFVLLNRCFNNFDNAVAEGALAQAQLKNWDAKRVIRSWVRAGHEPSHRIGQLQQSALSSWDLGQGPQPLPEAIAHADAVVLVGGERGTFRTANLARLAGKPILPVTAFDGAAKVLFEDEFLKLASVHPGTSRADDFAVLNEFQPANWSEYASAIVSLAQRLISGISVFVIMSFRPECDDTYGTIERVCRLVDLKTVRTDKTKETERIFARIIQGIHDAAFVIADVSVESLNVYYELGYAEALGKRVIVTAKEGTKLPFDTKDIPTLLWKDQTRLADSLRPQLEEITGRHSQD